MSMTKTQMQELDTKALVAIVNSTSPSGKFKVELAFAREELTRRNWDGK